MGIFNFARKPKVPPAYPQQAQGIDPYIWAAILGMDTTSYATTVSSTTVVGIPALDAAVNLVAQPVAQMMVSANVYNQIGLEVAVPEIIADPSYYLRPTEFYVQLVRTLLMHGNWFAIRFDDQLVPIDPQEVNIHTHRGYPQYEFRDELFDTTELLHIRKDSPINNPYVGQGIITKYRCALRGTLAQQQYGQNAFIQGGPRSVLSVGGPNGRPTADQIDAVKDKFEEFTESGKQTLILGAADLKYEALNWSPMDAQFIESQKIGFAQAVIMAGGLPSDIEAGFQSSENMTYQNLNAAVEDRRRRWYQPIASLIEEAFSELLPEGYELKANPESLLRATTAERFDVYERGLAMGIYDVDFIKNKEGLN